MVQFTLAYVALGFAVLLMVGGILTLVRRRTSGSLSTLQRIALLGGLGGMIVFICVAVLWLQH